MHPPLVGAKLVMLGVEVSATPWFLSPVNPNSCRYWYWEWFIAAFAFLHLTYFLGHFHNEAWWKEYILCDWRLWWCGVHGLLFSFFSLLVGPFIVLYSLPHPPHFFVSSTPTPKPTPQTGLQKNTMEEKTFSPTTESAASDNTTKIITSDKKNTNNNSQQDPIHPAVLTIFFSSK